MFITRSLLWASSNIVPKKEYCKRHFQSIHYMCTVWVFCKDIAFDKDTPIFGTSEFLFVRRGVVDEREIEMMNVEWRIFHLSRQIRQQVQKAVPPCGKCFALLMLSEFGRASSEEQED